MTVLWGIHNDERSLDLIGEGFISIGWAELGDLSRIPTDRESLKQRLAETYPDAKPGAIPVWAGLVHRFVDEMKIGDHVVLPHKADRTLGFGVVESDFYVDHEAELHPNRRKVAWVQHGVPRDDFPRSALNEIGSALTLFRVKSNASVFEPYFDSARPENAPAPADADDEVELVEDEPSAERVETYTRDFVVNILRRMDPYRFEHFIAGLLNAMGYRASATQSSSDGGVDVLASRDPLALEPPIIKVQCKRKTATVGAPEVQQLAGTLATGSAEVALFVTLGAYTTDAMRLERSRQDLRLINGQQLVDLILENYDKLSSEWRRLIPVRPVLAVDRSGID